jgi:hypothetical protein
MHSKEFAEKAPRVTFIFGPPAPIAMIICAEFSFFSVIIVAFAVESSTFCGSKQHG